MATTLRGARVRHRIAQLGWDLAKAGELSGIPHGTLRNNTREHAPQPIRLARAYALLAALNQPGLEPLEIGDILSSSGDGVPDPPPEQPKPKSKPQKREEKAGNAPKRPNGVAA